MASEAEQTTVLDSGVEPWPGRAREYAIRITLTRITGGLLRKALPD
jgi:hypothetical protein